MITELKLASDPALANPFLTPLGKIPTNREISDRLKCIPAPPDHSRPSHEWSYQVSKVEGIVIPDAEMISLARSIDLILRRSLEVRVPDTQDFNASLLRTNYPSHVIHASRAIYLSSISGVGKTVSCQRALAAYPQVYDHKVVPGYHGKFRQLVWLDAVVPGSGSLKDLALALIRRSSLVLKDPTVYARLSQGKSATQIFENWVQFAKNHALGLLFLDECQNLFELASLINRSKDGGIEMRVADDMCLKTLLSFLSDSGIAVVLAGTPDSLEILDKRFSIQQRLCSGGIHHLTRFLDPKDARLKDKLLPEYMKYQFRGGAISDTEELAEVIYENSAGINRLIQYQWQFANRIAADKKKRCRWRLITSGWPQAPT